MSIRHRAIRWAGAGAICVTVLGSTNVHAETLSLSDALERALQDNPSIRMSREQVRIGTDLERQAGFLPNPTLALGLENAAGSGPFQALDRAESSFEVTQKLELGGKRESRVEAAEAETGRAAAYVRSAERRLRAEVANAFHALLAAQERVALTADALARTGALIPALQERVNAGAASGADLNRGLLVRDLARIDADAAEADRAAARQNLIATWAGDPSQELEVRGELAQPEGALVSYHELQSALDEHPALQMAHRSVDVRRAEYDLERADAVPDLTVGLGARYLSDTDDTAMMLSFSMPLTVFDANQGNIAAATRRITRDELAVRETEADLRRALNVAYGSSERFCAEARQLRTSIVPNARQTERTIRRGYQRGAFTVLELLSATRDGIDSEKRLLDAELSCRVALNSLENLIGASPLVSTVVAEVSTDE